MPENLDIDPIVLRDLARQHDQVAHETREWAKPPEAWLQQFPATYGTIAEPVYKALRRFYAARQQAGNSLAAEHDRTAASLRAAAESYERADRDTATAITRIGTGTTDANGTGPTGTRSAGPQPRNGSPDHAAGNRQNGSMPGSTVAGGQPADPTREAADATGTATPRSTSAAPNLYTLTNSPPSDTVGAIPLSGTPGTAPSDLTRATPLNGPTEADPMTGAAVPPFAAAVNAARERAAGPAHMVGAVVDDDLVLAHTLLSALLAAIDPVVGVGWAVSVLRGPGGIGVFVTSNEGRGWLPPAVFLPCGVSTPWNWAHILGHDPATLWEGVADPARILVEFAQVWGEKAGAHITAVASSGAIDPRLRAELTTVATAERVLPVSELDLRILTPDTTDRLGLTGSTGALEHVALVPDSKVRAECLRLAADAHARWGRPRNPVPDAKQAWRLRNRILETLQTGEQVPEQWWGQLRDIDALLAAATAARRADVGQVALGEIRPNDDVLLYSLTFERRCTELVLLLATEPTRQSLRDAVYCHEQVVVHPRFEALASAVASTATAATPTTSGPTDVTAGPPRGVTVAPRGPIPEQPRHDRDGPTVSGR